MKFRWGLGFEFKVLGEEKSIPILGYKHLLMWKHRCVALRSSALLKATLVLLQVPVPKSKKGFNG
jgi:hypothetical protein